MTKLYGSNRFYNSLDKSAIPRYIRYQLLLREYYYLTKLVDGFGQQKFVSLYLAYSIGYLFVL